MTIESNITYEKPPLCSYPKLMADKAGNVVLMESHGVGMVLSGEQVGRIRSTFDMTDFSNFFDKITLQYKPEQKEEH